MVEKIVALDVGSSSLKAIEATVKNGAPVISRVASIPLDTHIVESGSIVSPDSFGRAVAKLWRDGKFTAKDVTTFVAGSPVVHRLVPDVPWARPEDFKKLLPHILGQKVPFEIDDYYLDAHTLDEYRKPGEPTPLKNIAVTGVEKKNTDTLVNALSSHRLMLRKIDTLPFSLIRAYAFTEPDQKGISIASVELGSDTTTIVIHKDYQPVYIHSAPHLGARNITDRLTSELSLSFAEAEFLKVALGLPSDIRSKVRTTVVLGSTPKQVTFESFGEEKIAAAQHIISQEVSNLIGHVNDIVDDSLGVTDNTPSKIILSGGGAGLATLRQRLGSEVAIKTELIRPFGDAQSKIVPDAVFAEQHRYAAVFGLLV